MDSGYVLKREFIEYEKRMEEEHARTNERLKVVEGQSKQITDLVVAVKELAMNMKAMSDEQINQREKLEALESRDGEMWRKVVGYVITTILGIAIGFIFNFLGM